MSQNPDEFDALKAAIDEAIEKLPGDETERDEIGTRWQCIRIDLDTADPGEAVPAARLVYHAVRSVVASHMGLPAKGITIASGAIPLSSLADDLDHITSLTGLPGKPTIPKGGKKSGIKAAGERARLDR
jgi:hypothetical protein